MGIGSQLIQCTVTECTHHKGNRCQLPQIEVSYCQKDVAEHRTRCLSFKEDSDMQ